MNFTILRFDTIDSTNSAALKEARQGTKEGLCVVARQQTAGRGRMGRVWISPPDAGLYFSVVLRPRIEMQYLPLITLMSGVAVHDAIAEFGLKPDIKWVNDVLVNEKKICGILAETTDTDEGLAVVVGIGINLTSTNFPPEIAGTATSLADELRRRVTPFDLEDPLVKFLNYWYEMLNGDNGPAEILHAWRQRSSYFSGKSVRVTLENETFTGVTDGLELNGALRLRRNDGSVTVIQAGDVERVRPA
jgi:BirA family biotin operon repressor/biotin-[acetyl-CoA-carboxylase] ligase